jgi:hypothetical protein
MIKINNKVTKSELKQLIHEAIDEMRMRRGPMPSAAQMAADNAKIDQQNAIADKFFTRKNIEADEPSVDLSKVSPSVIDNRKYTDVDTIDRVYLHRKKRIENLNDFINKYKKELVKHERDLKRAKLTKHRKLINACARLVKSYIDSINQFEIDVEYLKKSLVDLVKTKEQLQSGEHN